MNKTQVSIKYVYTAILAFLLIISASFFILRPYQNTFEDPVVSYFGQSKIIDTIPSEHGKCNTVFHKNLFVDGDVIRCYLNIKNIYKETILNPKVYLNDDWSLDFSSEPIDIKYKPSKYSVEILQEIKPNEEIEAYFELPIKGEGITFFQFVIVDKKLDVFMSSSNWWGEVYSVEDYIQVMNNFRSNLLTVASITLMLFVAIVSVGIEVFISNKSSQKLNDVAAKIEDIGNKQIKAIKEIKNNKKEGRQKR